MTDSTAKTGSKISLPVFFFLCIGLISAVSVLLDTDSLSASWVIAGVLFGLCFLILIVGAVTSKSENERARLVRMGLLLVVVSIISGGYGYVVSSHCAANSTSIVCPK